MILLIKIITLVILKMSIPQIDSLSYKINKLIPTQLILISSLHKNLKEKNPNFQLTILNLKLIMIYHMKPYKKAKEEILLIMIQRFKEDVIVKDLNV